MKTKLITLTGPSGFNKSIILKRLLQVSPDFVRVVSYTDRPKRENEEDGKDFYFISEADFTKMVEEERFLEWQKVPSNNFRYGKTKDEITTSFDNNAGKVMFTRVNIINLPVFKRHYPESISIFIDVKDTVTLNELLKNDPEVNCDEEFERRVKFATEERRRRHLADFIVHMKDTPEETIADILDIVNKVN